MGRHGIATLDGLVNLDEDEEVRLTAGSDGRRGTISADPRLRRIGWAWVVLNKHGTVLGGASGGLPGEVQTVLRAELFGAWHCLVHTNGHITLYIDNKTVVGGLQQIMRKSDVCL